jgi:hypothetical protein
MDAMVHGRMAMLKGARTEIATTGLVVVSGGKRVQATASAVKARPRISQTTIGDPAMASALPALQKIVRLGNMNRATRQSATTSL